jgi:hypothetical protein
MQWVFMRLGMPTLLIFLMSYILLFVGAVKIVFFKHFIENSKFKGKYSSQ